MPFSEFFRRLVTVLALVLLVWGMWVARGTLLIGFAAALLAVALSIPARRLQRLGLRRGWAVAVSVLGALILLAVVVDIWRKRRLGEL